MIRPACRRACQSLHRYVTPPPPHVPEAVNPETGQVERRRVRYVTYERFRWWLTRATVAFVALAVIATVAAKMAYDAGKQTGENARAATKDLRIQSASANRQTCLSGAELRILNAKGIDALRQAAIEELGISDPRRSAFTRAVQPSVDELLSQAAGRVVRTRPAGPIRRSTEESVRRLAQVRCAWRTVGNFGTAPPPGPVSTAPLAPPLLSPRLIGP